MNLISIARPWNPADIVERLMAIPPPLGEKAQVRADVPPPIGSDFLVPWKFP